MVSFYSDGTAGGTLKGTWWSDKSTNTVVHEFTAGDSKDTYLYVDSGSNPVNANGERVSYIPALGLEVVVGNQSLSQPVGDAHQATLVQGQSAWGSYWSTAWNDTKSGYLEAKTQLGHDMFPTTTGDYIRNASDPYGAGRAMDVLNLALRPAAKGIGGLSRPLWGDDGDIVAQEALRENNAKHPFILDPNHVFGVDERADLFGTTIVGLATAKVPELGIGGRVKSVAALDAIAAESGSINLMERGDGFVTNASRRADVDPNGMLDIMAHGDANSVEIGGRAVDHRVLANVIKNDPQYIGQDIRLLSCNVGSCPTGLAQNLSNKLGVDVVAPNNYLWAHPNGTLEIMGGRTVGGRLIPVPSQPGQWVRFTPNGG